MWGKELPQACGTNVEKGAGQTGTELVRTMLEQNGMKTLVEPKGWMDEVELEG